MANKNQGLFRLTTIVEDIPGHTGDFATLDVPLDVNSIALLDLENGRAYIISVREATLEVK